jgi:hemerythrin HHE cation binding domain-containing protein
MTERHSPFEAARQSLRLDRDALDALCTKFLLCAERGDWHACEALWDGFARRLELQMGLEESLLLPALACEGPAQARQAQRIRHEHWAIGRQIQRFDVAMREQELCASDVSAFVVALRRHVAFEDGLLYARAGRVDSPEAACQAPGAPRPAIKKAV